MPAITTNDIKTGMTLELDSGLFQIVDFQHVKPGKGHAFVRTTLKNVRTGAVVDRTFRSAERVERAIVDNNNNGIPDVMEDFVFPNIGAAAIGGAKDATSRTGTEPPPPGGDSDAGYATAGRALADTAASSPPPPVTTPTNPSITSGGLTGLTGATAAANKGRAIKLVVAAVAVAAVVVGILLLVT